MNCLLADNSHEISSFIFCEKAVKNLSSAEVVIDILKVYDDTMLDYFLSLCN